MAKETSSSIQISPNCKSKVPYHRYWFSYRFFMVLLASFGICAMGISSSGIGFALVCMVNSSSSIDLLIDHVNVSEQSPEAYGQCSSKSSISNDSSLPSDDILVTGAFNWSKSDQAWILAAYNWGCIWLLIPTGVILDKYGPKLVFSIANSVLLLTHFISPIVALNLGVWGLFAVRFIMGMFGAMQVPSMFKLVRHWTSPDEVGISIALSMCGVSVGGLFIFFTSGYLCTSSWCWPSIFYFSGAVIVFWEFLWIIFFTNNPEDNRFASEKEIDYILSRGLNKKQSLLIRSLKVPYWDIFTSKPVLAAWVGNVAQGWLQLSIPAFLPQYQRDVLGSSLEENSLLSAINFIAQITFRLISGILSDVSQTKIGPTNSVKLFQTLCQLVPAGLLVGVAFLDCRNKTLIIVLLCLQAGFTNVNVAGNIKSMALTSGPYSGTVVAVSQVAWYGGSIGMPYAITALIPQGTHVQWMHTFVLLAAIAIIAWFVFMIFGSAHIEPWAVVKEEKTKDMPQISPIAIPKLLTFTKKRVTCMDLLRFGMHKL